jgi:hypothetical protein
VGDVEFDVVDTPIMAGEYWFVALSDKPYQLSSTLDASYDVRYLNGWSFAGGFPATMPALNSEVSYARSVWMVTHD